MTINAIKEVDLSKNRFDETLQIRTLEISGIHCKPAYSRFKLSTNVCYLALDDYEVDNYKVDIILVKLNLCCCHFSSPQGIRFGPNSLKILHLFNCGLSNVNIDLPYSLEEAEFITRDFTNIPPVLAYLKNLKILHVKDDHGKYGVKHSNFEIGLVGNTVIKQNRKRMLIASLPESIEYLWSQEYHVRDDDEGIPQRKVLNELVSGLLLNYYPGTLEQQSA
ncbi:hypothetical protein CANMA_004518 [Candida margitis]|uniref:uncharacterized protein n=1 Tax=Candida margitis TaxID=1775924 RepID=UPI0022265192|nr:uncharacterized protein CANMA_004518 [Candida margitis]KAI5956089.1 hypothetical protein CANMA_004518 [Candida margitis]